MRSHLFTGEKKTTSKGWHTPSKATAPGNIGTSWEKHIPFTNVIWVRYLLAWLRQQLDRNGSEDKARVREFTREVNEFQTRLKSMGDDGFKSATDILMYMMECGWLTREQVQGEPAQGDRVVAGRVS
jgi:hypothetical protein